MKSAALNPLLSSSAPSASRFCCSSGGGKFNNASTKAQSSGYPLASCCAPSYAFFNRVSTLCFRAPLLWARNVVVERDLGDLNPKSVISSGYQLLQTNPYREGECWIFWRQILPSTFVNSCLHLSTPPTSAFPAPIIGWIGEVEQRRLLYWCGFYGGSIC